jgi:transposase
MWELTDQAYIRLQPLLPADSGRGKPWRDHRQILDGILWKLHTGAPVAGPAHQVRTVADLLWPAAPLAARGDLAQAVGPAEQ